MLEAYGIVIPVDELTKLPEEPEDKRKDEKKKEDGGDKA